LSGVKKGRKNRKMCFMAGGGVERLVGGLWVASGALTWWGLARLCRGAAGVGPKTFFLVETPRRSNRIRGQIYYHFATCLPPWRLDGPNIANPWLHTSGRAVKLGSLGPQGKLPTTEFYEGSSPSRSRTTACHFASRPMRK